MRKITFGQLLVLALGIIFILRFVTGAALLARHPYHGWERLVALIAAIFCFAWFVGLRRRLIWAWYVGCGVFLLTIIQILVVQGVLIFAQEFKSDPFFGWGALISQTVFALIVFFILTYWWIPKKREFHSASGA
jgi:hypothetical protein